MVQTVSTTADGAPVGNSWILKMKPWARGKRKSKVLPLLCCPFNLAFAYMGYFGDFSGQSIFRK